MEIQENLHCSVHVHVQFCIISAEEQPYPFITITNLLVIRYKLIKQIKTACQKSQDKGLMQFNRTFLFKFCETLKQPLP